ncbi:MAG TPA: hypothetical protein VKU41_08600, partial [Polyangiaceae bacterium]|nr:hypothetical protein [Polyangiaceae bacterium]
SDRGLLVAAAGLAAGLGCSSTLDVGATAGPVDAGTEGAATGDGTVIDAPIADAVLVPSVGDDSPVAIISSYDGPVLTTLPPGVLATGQSQPGAIAVDDTYVYWANADPRGGDAILRCAKTGCGNAPEVLATGQWGPPANLVVRAGRLYWGGTFAVAECAVSGCSRPTFDLAGNAVGSVALDSSGDVFFVANTQVLRASGDLDGSTVVTLFANPADAAAAGPEWRTQSIAIDGTTLFALETAGGGVFSCDLGDCVATAAVRGAIEIGPLGTVLADLLAFDANNIYLVDVVRSAGTTSSSLLLLPRASLAPVASEAGAGMDIATPLVAGLSAPAAIVADGTTVYFADQGDRTPAGGAVPGAGRIGKCPATGCNGAAQVIKDYLSSPSAIAVDDTNVYWTEQGAGGDAGAGLTGRVVFHVK